MPPPRLKGFSSVPGLGWGGHHPPVNLLGSAWVPWVVSWVPPTPTLSAVGFII